MRILLVEDDAAVGEAAKAGLRQHGLVCDWVQTAAEYQGAMVNHSYDCILLDLTLPDGSGKRLLQTTRAREDHTPVIVLTAQSRGETSASLLDTGADDYVVKPYDINDLIARIRAVLRRSRAADESVSLTHGPLTLNVEGRVALWHGELVPLTKKEYWLLEAFMRQRNRILSRAQLEDALYGWGDEKESNTVEVYIHHVRKKFANELIVTIRGLGYQLGQESALMVTK